MFMGGMDPSMAAPPTKAVCERFLKNLGMNQCRIVIHGELIRICPSATEMNRFVESSIRETIVRGFKDLGFTYVSLDINDPL